MSAAGLDLIAFDADDTLWDNEPLYQMGRARFESLMGKYGPLDDLNTLADKLEVENLRYYGYGALSFVLSLIEAAIQWSQGRVTAGDIGGLIDLGKEMILADLPLLDGAEETVAELSKTYPLVLITKGDLLHQQLKAERSGLMPYFKKVEIVSEKSPEAYSLILKEFGVAADRFMMVGNSMRSDILPVLGLGGWAVHIPNAMTWAHENADIESAPGERLLEAASLRELPALIEALARRPGAAGARSG